MSTITSTSTIKITMSMDLFYQRRKNFMNHMKDGVAIFFAAPVRNRNHDVDFEYRQDSDFYYLTGFEEPEAVCVFSPANPVQQVTLFVVPRDPLKETWTGISTGVEGAIKDYGANRAYPITELEDVLPQFLQNSPRLYYSLNKYPEADRIVFAALDQVKQMHRAGIYPPHEILDPSEILSEMRVVKTQDDLQILQQAIDLSAKGHIAAMKATNPGKFEYEIQAVVEYVFRTGGSSRNGYPSIVGSGPNSCILHYIHNKRQMHENDLLLVDAGAEFGYFTGDVTRTYPVSGRFTSEQKAIYEIVLETQKKAIATVRPGNTFMQVHEIAVRFLTEGLVSLGILKGTVDEMIEKEEYKKYFMHRTSHWLGMDVHDTGKYQKDGEWRILQEGMVLTVEPGIYIGSDEEREEFRNIGIRIEDDVLVTSDGAKVLSAVCPKEIPELEELVGSGWKP